jgi:hypothetical protein
MAESESTGSSGVAPAATVTVPEPATSPAAGGDWRAGLPADLVADKSLARYQDVGSLAKAYLEAERRIGAPLTAPGPDAKPEQLAAYRQRLGVPELDKYEIDLPAPIEGAGFQWDPHWVGRMKESFHKAHMTPAQSKAVADLFHEYMHSMADRTRAAGVPEDQQERAAAIKELEQHWGPQGGAQWRYHEARARTAVNTLMEGKSDTARQRIYELASDPEFAAALSEMADGLLERGFIDGQELPAGTSIAAASARKQALLAEMAKDPMHPLKNPQHPAREATMREWEELNRIEAGSGAQYRRFGR